MLSGRQILEKSLQNSEILKTNKNDFLYKFLRGSEKYLDYKYIYENFPEYIHTFNIHERWNDTCRCQKIVEGNTAFILNSQSVILGEIYFDNNGKVKFGRYSDEGLFIKKSYKTVYKNKIYICSIPNEELSIPSEAKDDFYFLLDDEKFSFESSKMYSLETIKIRENNQEKLEITYDYFNGDIKLYDLTNDYTKIENDKYKKNIAKIKSNIQKIGRNNRGDINSFIEEYLSVKELYQAIFK